MQSVPVGMEEACGPSSPAGAGGSPSWWSQGLKGWRGVLCREAVFPWRAPCPHTLRRGGSGVVSGTGTPFPGSVHLLLPCGVIVSF